MRMRGSPVARPRRAGTTWLPALKAVLFPAPPRRIPAQRALAIALRTAHLMTFGALVGGHLFEVDPGRLLALLVATAASGAALMALECWATAEWLFMGKGLAVLLKLGLLALIPVFWEHRLLLLFGIIAVASVGAHMPSRFRHRSLLTVPTASRVDADRPVDTAQEIARGRDLSSNAGRVA